MKKKRRQPADPATAAIDVHSRRERFCPTRDGLVPEHVGAVMGEGPGIASREPRRPVRS